MTPWIDNNGKTWDLDQPFVFNDRDRYLFYGWFQASLSPGEPIRPLVAKGKLFVGHPDLVVLPYSMIGWSQSHSSLGY